MVQILVRRLDEGLPLPSYAHPGDAGADLRTTVDVTLAPGERALVPTGIAIALPEGFVALVHPRSGLAARHGVSIVNAPGTIDSGYRGEVKVLLVNLDPGSTVHLTRGDRVAQLVVQRFERADFAEVADLPESVRGAGGYGSTGGFAATADHVGGDHAEDEHRGGAPVRLRRKAGVPPENEGISDESVLEADPAPPSRGPLDADDLDLEDDPSFANHIDLGGLLVARPPEGIDLRLQVDEESGTVLAVLLAGEDGALELRPFAARRGGDLWAEIRPQIASETARHGGTASERDGAFGTELVCMVPVTTPDGQAATQPSRVIGCNGPRWFLRATLLGLPAVEPDQAGVWEEAIRTTVVRRGADAMPPGESLPLTLPPEAERV